MSCPVRKRTADGRGRAGVLLTIFTLTRVKDASHPAPGAREFFRTCYQNVAVGSLSATRRPGKPRGCSRSYEEPVPPAADGALAPAVVIPKPRFDSRNVAFLSVDSIPMQVKKAL